MKYRRTAVIIVNMVKKHQGPLKLDHAVPTSNII